MPLTREHWKAGIALFFSFVIEAWEMMIIIMASGMIAGDFRLRERELGSLMGSIYLGMIPGCLLWGKITDRIGRKKSMVASLATYGVILAGQLLFSHLLDSVGDTLPLRDRVIRSLGFGVHLL